MAAVRHRIHTERADWIIYITDAGQSQHFDMVFAGARKAGYLPGEQPSMCSHAYSPRSL